MGDHLEIIIFSSILLILLNGLISLSELHKTPNIHPVECGYVAMIKTVAKRLLKWPTGRVAPTYATNHHVSGNCILLQ